MRGARPSALSSQDYDHNTIFLVVQIAARLLLGLVGGFVSTFCEGQDLKDLV